MTRFCDEWDSAAPAQVMVWHAGNQIHPRAIIGPNVHIGRNNVIGPNTIILGYVSIGNGNTFLNCTIGAPAEKHGFFHKQDGRIVIGNNCIFREYVTVHLGTGGSTWIGNDVLMLRGSHAGHDSIIEDGAIVSCNAMIGGHSHVMRKANLALGCVIHQHSVIGSYSMIGMGGVVIKRSQIVPGQIFAGNPVRHIRENTVGLFRNKIDASGLIEERERYNKIVSNMNG